MNANIGKMKRQPIEWEKTVISDMTFNKELKSKICKQITQFNIKKIKRTIQLKNWPKTWMDIFPKKIYRLLTST